MRLTVDALRPLRAALSECSTRSYPDEACGLILSRNGRLEAWCCENQQNRLHEADPVRFPRTAETAYSLDPRKWMEAEDSGADIVAVFHSHPDRGAYFSDEDVLQALGGDPAGEPVLGSVEYVVLASRKDGVADMKVFGWSAESRSFEERH